METSTSKKMLQVGAKLQGGKYVVKKQLSSGGFGNTYVVVDKQFEDEFALKEFFIKGINDRPDDGTNVSISNAVNSQLFESQKEKFKKEARRLRKLNNKHIVRVYDLFEENDTAYYVMDYVRGESLSSRLKRTGTPLSEQEALDILEQILDALEEVHKLKIWHLDLKPGNVLVNDKGNAVLIDFGASKQISSSKGYETTTTSMCYTPGYAPTEQIDQDMSKIGPWTDLYALGATLYNLLTCSAPPTVSEIYEGDAFKYPPYVSNKTRKLVEWLMTPARLKRPQSITDVRNYLHPNDFESKQGDNEETIIGGNFYKNGNNSINENNIDVVHKVDQDKVSDYTPEPENNHLWLKITAGLLGAILVSLFMGPLGCGNKTAQAEAVDSDSVFFDSVFADSVVAYDYCDTVVADTAIAW